MTHLEHGPYHQTPQISVGRDLESPVVLLEMVSKVSRGHRDRESIGQHIQRGNALQIPFS